MLVRKLTQVRCFVQCPATRGQRNCDLNTNLSESQTCYSLPQPHLQRTCHCWPQESCPRLQVNPILTQSLSHCRTQTQSPAPHHLCLHPDPRASHSWHTLPTPQNPRGHPPCPRPPAPRHPSLLTGHGHEHGKSSKDPSQALAAEEEGAIGGGHGAQLSKEAALQNCTEGCGGTRTGTAAQLGRLQGLPGGGVSRTYCGLWMRLVGILWGNNPHHSSSEVHPYTCRSGVRRPALRAAGACHSDFPSPSGPQFLIRDMGAAAAAFPFWIHWALLVTKRRLG